LRAAATGRGGGRADPAGRRISRAAHSLGDDTSAHTGGWFEIDHEDIEGYMPAMKMQWRVRDKALLNSLSGGDKVDFTLEDDNGSELITGIKKAPAAR
jgi:hypothetical protein